MHMADIRRTKKLRQLATELREACALRGVTLVVGEAEDILADKISAIARQIGVTERTIIDNYMPVGMISELAQAVAAVNDEYQDAAQSTEPVTLGASEAGRVIAALGMTMKLATQALQLPGSRSETLGVATDLADAVVGMGVAIESTGEGQPVQVGGSTLVYTRKVLRQTIDLLGDGTWVCPCPSRHVPDATCELQRTLAGDLHLIGGWIGGADEPPADGRLPTDPRSR